MARCLFFVMLFLLIIFRWYTGDKLAFILNLPLIFSGKTWKFPERTCYCLLLGENPRLTLINIITLDISSSWEVGRYWRRQNKEKKIETCRTIKEIDKTHKLHIQESAINTVTYWDGFFVYIFKIKISFINFSVGYIVWYLSQKVLSKFYQILFYFMLYSLE